MAERWLIGLDDTDLPDTRGTGRLARMLAAQAERLGLARCGVTRHQLLVHPDVPYTTHNSAACVALEGCVADPCALAERLGRYVAEHSPPGADPGICLTRADAVAAALAFGRCAQRRVVTRAQAERIAAAAGFLLRALGGTGDGVIGALAAAALRAGGDDGRFIEVGRIRQVTVRVRVRTLLEAGADAVCGATDATDTAASGPAGAAPAPDDWVETHDWVRPRLIGGRAVVIVERKDEDGKEWAVADRRSRGA